MFDGIADYPAFLLAVIVFLLIPGPGNLALITSTGKGGVKAGLAAGCGLILGDQLLLWLAVAGVASLLAAWPSVFHAVRIVGAAYLAWLGWRLLRSRPGDKPVLDMKPRHYLRQAVLITLLNPKAVVFYMAFLPLFIDPSRQPQLSTFAVMAVTIVVLTSLYAVTIVLLTRYLADRLRASPATATFLQRLAGVFLVGFGLKLALSS